MLVIFCRYMRQVSPDGRLVDSLSSGPEEGLRGEETPAGRVDYEALIKQIEAKMGSNNSTQGEKWALFRNILQPFVFHFMSCY